MDKTDKVLVVGNGPSANKLEIAHVRNKHIIVTNFWFLSKHLLSLAPQHWVLIDPGFWRDALCIRGFHVGLDIIDKIGLKLNIYYPAEFGQPVKDLPSSIIPHPINFRPLDQKDLESGAQINLGAAYPHLRQASLCVCLMVAASLNPGSVELIGHDFTTWSLPKEEFSEAFDIHCYSGEGVSDFTSAQIIRDELESRKSDEPFESHVKSIRNLEIQLAVISRIYANLGIQLINSSNPTSNLIWQNSQRVSFRV